MNPSASHPLPMTPRRGPAPAVADARRPVVSKRVVAATVAGNALEFYDFVTYAFFAVYIGKTFFPAATPLGSLLHRRTRKSSRRCNA